MTDQLTRRPLLDQQWELAPMVEIRPEPFGALAYHFGTRRLTFLKRVELARAVQLLSDSPDVRTALTEAGVSMADWDVYATALESLADAGMICRRATESVDRDRA
jgi:putative mycofactocin binding protein MftB